jgi:hypothetical protein
LILILWINELSDGCQFPGSNILELVTQTA